jgi:DNA-3-methyladenine glycosylase
VHLRRLRRAELPEDTVALATFLIGCAIVSEAAPARTAARIVETEAYLPGDAAAHSFRGETPRNRTLFMRRGHAYVYFIYGNHYCLNVSSERAGVGAGVLLRAAEPLVGEGVMRGRRGVTALRDLCRGPGRLAQALAIGRADDGVDLCAPGPLWLAAPPGGAAAERCARAVGISTRIGLTKEAHRPLRFFERGSPFVSGPARLNV